MRCCDVGRDELGCRFRRPTTFGGRSLLAACAKGWIRSAYRGCLDTAISRWFAGISGSRRVTYARRTRSMDLLRHYCDLATRGCQQDASDQMRGEHDAD